MAAVMSAVAIPVRGSRAVVAAGQGRLEAERRGLLVPDLGALREADRVTLAVRVPWVADRRWYHEAVGQPHRRRR